AHCVLIHEERDKRIQQFFLANRYPSEDMVSRVLDALALRDASATTLQDLHDSIGDISLRKLQVVLRMLTDTGDVRRQADGRYCLQDKTADASRAREAVLQYEARAEHDRETLAAMVSYARSGMCRWRTILEYFGDAPQWQRCDHCDSCLLAREVEAQVREAPVQRENDLPTRQANPRFQCGDLVSVRRYGQGTVQVFTRE